MSDGSVTQASPNKVNARHKSKGSDGSSDNVLPRSSIDSYAVPSASPERRYTINAPTSDHQPIVLADSVAYSFLKADPGTIVIHDRVILKGFALHLIEQWATARVHPTFVIATYTGNDADTISANVLGVPKTESSWSSRLKSYFQAIDQTYNTRRSTEYGHIMITDLEAFPASLTHVRIPQGDLAAARPLFLINENLKRLACSSSKVLDFVRPDEATAAKFHKLYLLTEKLTLHEAIPGLVRLCQTALHLFGLLNLETADGLLCDVTEKAITDWWLVIGSDVYNIEPRDGILGPTTVCAVLGCLLGARRRLHSLGIGCPKDPLAVDDMKRAIADFQKTHGIKKTRRLDRDTLLSLHELSAELGSASKWSVPAAVKVTVAELSGRNIQPTLSAGDQHEQGHEEVETTDIQRFQQALFGEQCKWLWHGKTSNRVMTVLRGDHTSTDPPSATLGLPYDLPGITSPERPSARQVVAQKASDLIQESRTGLDRIKDGVKQRSHMRRHSLADKALPSRHTDDTDRAAHARQASSIDADADYKERQSSSKASNQILGANRGRVSEDDGAPSDMPEYSTGVQGSQQNTDNDLQPDTGQVALSNGPADPRIDRTAEDFWTHSSGRDGSLLQRRKSAVDASRPDGGSYTAASRRHLSFSDAEDSVLGKTFAQQYGVTTSSGFNLLDQVKLETSYADMLKILSQSLDKISSQDATWTEEQLSNVARLVLDTQTELQNTENAHTEKAALLQDLQRRSTSAIHDQRALLENEERELNVLGSKLDYEITSFRDKLEDIEQSLGDFERSVRDAEQRVDQLEKAGLRSSESQCVMS